MNEKLVAKVRALFGRGWEKPDPTPVAPPVGFVHQPSLHERIRDAVLMEMRQRGEAGGFETPEEADDFDVDEDLFPASPHEIGEIDAPTPPAPRPPASSAPSQPAGPVPSPAPSTPPVAG